MEALTSLGSQASNGKSPKPEEIAILSKIMEQKALEEKKAKWAGWAESEYTKCKNARVPFERQWFLNLAFTAGRQYVAPVEIVGKGFTLTSPKAPKWRVRLVINKIRTAVRTECAKLTSNKPIPTVLPSTSENEDLSAAKVAETLLKTAFNRAEFMRTYRSWVWWGVVCGNSFLKTYWNPGAKDYEAMQMPPPPTMPDGSPVDPRIIEANPQLKQMMNTPVPGSGKICVERINPFHIYVPDLLEEDLQKQPYVIHTMTCTPLYVKQTYGVDATPDTRASNTILESAMLITKNAENHFDAVTVIEVWIRPNAHPDFPEGGMLTIINHKCVQALTSWPLPFETYPFHKYDGIPTGGFYSDSIVVDLIPIQKEYNRTRSQIIEIKNTMGKPKFLYQKGSINPRQISSEPGQAIPYTAGYQPPIPLPAQEAPVTMINEIQSLTAEFDDISGQHEITRGSTPSQVTSGTAIAFLQEQDDTKLSYQVASIENCIENLGTQYLKFVATYWDEVRVIKVAGRESSYEALRWKGNDLKGNTDVKVQSGSALPYSKAAKQALITDLMTQGFLDPLEGLDLMEMPVLGRALDAIMVDKRQAYRENAKMADLAPEIIQMFLQPQPGPNGEPPPPPVEGPNGMQQFNGDGTPFQPKPPVPVNSWDNHEAHYQFHNEFRKSQEFELLDEDKKQAFELHVQLHQFALMSTMVNAQGMQVGNGPPTEGTEPPPEEELPPA